MRCQDCGNTDCFVLVVELAVSACVPPGFDGLPERLGVPPVAGRPTFADPDWALAVECAACASTDVIGDAVSLLAARTR